MKIKIKNYSITNLLLFVFAISAVNTGFSQIEEVLEIEWAESKTLTFDNKTFIIPSIKNQVLDGNKPNFFYRKEVGSNFRADLSLEIVSTIDATTRDVNYLKNQFIAVESEQYLSLIHI